MKKILVTLFALLLMVGVVYADEVNVNGNTSGQVKVGNVETPVYNATIEWENLTFDWKYLYDGTNYNYGWDYVRQCEKLLTNEDVENEWMKAADTYTDNTCTVATDHDWDNIDVTTTDYYAIVSYAPKITITDTSENGTITPSITWTPVTKYNYTTASFYYDTLNDGVNDLTTSEIPSNGRICAMGDYDDVTQQNVCSSDPMNEYYYNVSFRLDVDRTKTVTTPTAGDTIGSVTITLAAN